MSIKLLNRVATALVAALIASPCLAADETTNEDEPAMEEIIVTATYRDTRLMDTPLAITAVTAEDLVSKGIEDMRTLYQAIPGLSYSGLGPASSFLSIRGITPSAAPGSVAAVGVYLDNLPITDSSSQGAKQPIGALFDMERVEVLKGPQGTLYGEGNLGGNIRYVTNKPDTSGLDYHVRSSVENMAHSDDLSYRIDAMVNIPLADQLALRLVGYRRDRAGVLDQVAPRNQKDVDTFEENGLRAAFKWDASETFEVTAMVNVVNSEMEGPVIAFHCYTEPFRETDPPGGKVPLYDLPGTTCARGRTDLFDHGDPYVTHSAHETMVNGGFDDQTNYNFSIDWELPFADLVSSTSYFDRETHYTEEVGGGEPGISGLVNDSACFGQLSVCGPGTMSAFAGDGSGHSSSERFVQELRLISNTDGPLQWTLGAYFKDDDSQLGRIGPCYKGGPPAYANIDNCWFVFGFFPDVPVEDQVQIIQWFTGLYPFAQGAYLSFKEQAIYGEASYRLSDQWEIQLGLRLAEVEHRTDVGRSGVNSKVDPLVSLAKPSDIVAPKVTLTWRPMKDWMVYATYSEGFRPGIINTRLVTKIAQMGEAVNDPDLPAEIRALAQAEIDRTSGFQTTESDFVENYELGIKASVLGGRLSFTGSLYRIAFEDMFILVFDRFPRGLPGRRNATYGINVGSAESEGLELEVRLALTDNLFLTFGGDKSFKAHLGSVREGLDVRRITPGARMPNAPEYSYNASLAYDFELFGMNATARADTYGIASSIGLTGGLLSKPAYRTTDLKLLVNLDNWMLSAYVRNVTEEKIVYENFSGGYVLGHPRTFGVQVNYRM